ncbi:MAG: exodeoxyribonuclease V subunit beta [Candidatus Thiodiazotropha sp.]
MGMHLASVELRGINLVEASAGTGKTHTLTALYLRLLLEQGLAPESILVVTYTQAATAELKGRIRQRLLEARTLLAGGECNDDGLAALLAGVAAPDTALKRLDLAIAGFDQAAIFTIHGFCQRVLTEQAFETGQPFSVELVPDQSVRLQQIADDFWRREMERLPPLFLETLRGRIPGPESLLQRLRVALGKPYLRVRAAAWPDDLPRLEAAALELQAALRTLWAREGENVQRLLSDGRVLKGNVYRASWVGGWCSEMTRWLSGTPYDEPFDKVERFTTGTIAAAVKAGQTPPQHPFFDRLEVYLQTAEACVRAGRQAQVAVQAAFHDFLMAELPKRQAEAGEWSYDDLLLRLHQALLDAGGERLSALLRSRYPAALVDEFQDTDPVQYEILQQIYRGSPLPLFLVGDPKQAIYSFRGADIFAYLRARRDAAAAVHTLDSNWRSTPALVAAVNALFETPSRPFFYSEIDFQPVKPAPRPKQRLQVRGDGEAALRIWQLPFDRQSRVEAARSAVADATADEIARLLKLAEKGAARIGTQALGGGDFAVLVRTHAQAERIAASLRERGINSVRNSQQSVFRSAEAESLQRLLMALLEPRRASLVRAALATPLLGWDAERIDRLNRDDRALGDCLARFHEFHRLWQRRGFIVMFRRLLAAEGIENRLLEFRDGERRLTNLYHLAELLHQQATTTWCGMEGLLKWLVRQREARAQDEQLLRLESDSHLVKIDTLHGSKGLEYPIVFCPYLWDESEGLADDRPYLFHDPAADYAAVLEIGSDGFARDRQRLQEESLAESLRLLYVALTRAEQRCYLPWGPVKNSETSALCWLLHSGRTIADETPPEAWYARARAMSAEAQQQDLEGLVARAGGSIDLSPLPADGMPGQMALAMPPTLTLARHFSARIEAVRRVASFSSLAAGRPEDHPDHDAQTLGETLLLPPLAGDDIHGFPRGAGPGSCLHAVLELVDFTAPADVDLMPLITRLLRLHVIEERWAPVVAGMVRDLTATPLNREGLALGSVAPSRRVNEMAFHFPVHRLSPVAILRLAERHGFSQTPGMIEGLAGLDVPAVDGFLKGFIDLVFESQGRYYLADYKSNWLGDGVEAYHQTALRDAMVEHHYPLQYALYTLALHRYLGLRLPGYDYERHFGGVYYLFLRGMQPSSGAQFGVVAERPPLAFIDALDGVIREATP